MVELVTGDGSVVGARGVEAGTETGDVAHAAEDSMTSSRYL
jgi:hypothetical protein